MFETCTFWSRQLVMPFQKYRKLTPSSLFWPDPGSRFRISWGCELTFGLRTSDPGKDQGVRWGQGPLAELFALPGQDFLSPFAGMELFFYSTLSLKVRHFKNPLLQVEVSVPSPLLHRAWSPAPTPLLKLKLAVAETDRRPEAATASPPLPALVSPFLFAFIPRRPLTF